MDNSAQTVQEISTPASPTSASTSGPDLTALNPADEAINLIDIDVSALNRSYDAELDVDRVDALAADILAHGLLHALTLKRFFVNGKAHYWLIAGAHRFEALLKLRGASGRLMTGEFMLLPDEISDENCLAISIAENSCRAEVSTITTARYVARLARNGMTQEALAKALNMPKARINALLKLALRWNELPTSWRKDLEAIPGTPAYDDIRISLTHWAEVSPKLPKSALTDRDRERLNGFRGKHYSARILAQAVERSSLFFHDEIEGDEAASEYKSEQESTRTVMPAPSTGPASPKGLPQPFEMDPDYVTLNDTLEGAVVLCGHDVQLFNGVQRLIGTVQKRLQRTA